MVRHACCHSRGLGPEDPILATAERFVGPDQIVAGHADSKLGFQPAHRTGHSRCLARQMGIPQPPVQIGTFDICGVDRLTGRLCQSRKNVLLAPIDHLTFDLDHLRTLARLMNRGVIQIRINDLLRIPGPPGFARRCWRVQFVKQLAQNRAVMGQFIRDKQGLALTAGGQIFQYPPSIVQSASANPESNQQPRGGIYSRPDPRPSVLVFEVFGTARTFLFFTKVHSSSSWASVSFNEASRPEST